MSQICLIIASKILNKNIVPLPMLLFTQILPKRSTFYQEEDNLYAKKDL